MQQQHLERARDQLEPRVNQAVAEAESQARPFSLIVLDVDELRRINETYGHDVGDQVLAELPIVVGQHVAPQEALIRWGGEEYAILCPGKAIGESETLAETVRRTVEGHTFPGAGRVTISLGVASHREREPAMDLIGRAVEATYRAKEKGRNQVQIA